MNYHLELKNVRKNFGPTSIIRGANLNIKKGLSNNIPGDLLSIDIKEAIENLGEITGEITNDELLGNIFGKFCIGK